MTKTKKIALNNNSCIFCDFASGKYKEHRNKYLFEILNETKHTLTFHSIDFPSPKREHLLVIPKKHYVNLSDCPPNVLHDLIDQVSLMSKALRLKNEGCNILLNDGRSAEQTVMHAHFHLVSRNKRDGIKIELWKRVNVSEKKFKELNKNVKKLITKAKKSN
jgi:histidine triad (HIT) family protein